MSPTQLSLRHLRSQGYTAQVVEHFNTFAKIRVDLFGCIDIIAIKPGVTGVIGVQTTSYDNISARKKKALESPEIALFIACSNQFVIHGWHKKENRWVVKEMILEKPLS